MILNVFVFNSCIYDASEWRCERWTLADVLGPQRISSNSTSFSVVLPTCFNPTAAGPSLQMRGSLDCLADPFVLYVDSCGLLKPPFTVSVTFTNQHQAWWPVSIWGLMSEYWRVFTHMLREIWCKKMMKTVHDSGVSGISLGCQAFS